MLSLPAASAGRAFSKAMLPNLNSQEAELKIYFQLFLVCLNGESAVRCFKSLLTLFCGSGPHWFSHSLPLRGTEDRKREKKGNVLNIVLLIDVDKSMQKQLSYVDIVLCLRALVTHPSLSLSLS